MRDGPHHQAQAGRDDERVAALRRRREPRRRACQGAGGHPWRRSGGAAAAAGGTAAARGRIRNVGGEDRMSAGWVDSAALLAEIERWMTELRERGLRGEAELAELAAQLAQSRGERLDLPTDAILVVLLCGPTTVGKSTLINTLAGAEISRPGLGATTSAAVIYLHEDDNPERLFEYGREIGQLARAPQTVVRHR